MALGREKFVWVLGVSLGLSLTVGCHQAGSEEPCDGPTLEVPSEETPPPPAPLAEPFVHTAAANFAPSMVAIASGDHPLTSAEIGDYDSCASCHEEIAAQWRTSAHAYASFNNPIYRMALERFRSQDGGREGSRFCAGCHDLALLVDGAMDVEVQAQDPRAHVGIACVNCHGVADSSADGNGSYTLASTELPVPELDDEASIERHRAAMGPAREQCFSCHRAFIGVETGHPHHLPATDEPGPWRDSSYAGSKLRLDTPVQERHCSDCHMPREVADPEADPAVGADGKLRSHRFMAAHTWLAAMRGDDETLARVQEFLRGVASIDIAAVELEGQRYLLGHGLDPASRGRMVVDLVVRNLAVGHHFPGGTRDAQHTWIALQVLDGQGRVVASIDEDSASADVHRLRAGVVDEHGRVRAAREVETVRAVAFDHTVAPRDAVIVRYAVDLPSEAVGPLRVEARLLHRSRALELADQTCAESKTRQGRAFLAASAKLTGERLDPCVEPPVTEVSRYTLSLGAGPDPSHPDPSHPDQGRPDHERLWELGMALYHQVQERLPEARKALAAAEQALDGAGLPKAERDAAEARILAALGTVAARQGRVDEALELADRIAVLNPDHPYPHLLRGRALAKVWRWEQAVPHLELALAASPGSTQLASELATACGSAGMHRRALEVAAGALAQHPRNSALLRSQALALRSLEDPRAEAALEAYFKHRVPDDQPHLAATCGERDPACARERVPVHVHE